MHTPQIKNLLGLEGLAAFSEMTLLRHVLGSDVEGPTINKMFDALIHIPESRRRFALDQPEAYLGEICSSEDQW